MRDEKSVRANKTHSKNQGNMPLSKREIKKQHRKRVKENKEYIGFNKFKRRELTGGIIKSILLALIVSFVVGGIIAIILKLIPFDFNSLHWLAQAVIFLAFELIPILFMPSAFVLTAVPAFFILKKRDKHLARELDQGLNLKEGIQTSLEYSTSNSTMSMLLKEDIKQKTSKIKPRAHKIKKLPAYIVPMVLCGLFFFVSMVWPFKQVAPPKPEEKAPFELTEMQEKQLEAIIVRVESSNMKEPAKTEVADEVRALLNVLKVTTIKEDAEVLIDLSVKKIDTITKSTGTSYQLYELLLESDNAYTKEMGRLLTLLDWSKFKIKREKIRAYFEHKDYGTEDADIAKITKDTALLVREAGSELRSALLKSGIDESDKLYGELLSTATRMEKLASELENGYINYHATVGTTEYGAIFDLIEDDIYRALDEQNISYSVGFGASDEIRKMFDFNIPNREDNGSEKKEDEENDDSDEKEDKPTDGGGTSGSDIYGSDDQIYDKNEGYIKYGEVLNTYYQIMGSTEYTEEQKLEIQKYFETLFRGLEEEKGE